MKFSVIREQHKEKESFNNKLMTSFGKILIDAFETFNCKKSNITSINDNLISFKHSNFKKLAMN